MWFVLQWNIILFIHRKKGSAQTFYVAGTPQKPCVKGRKDAVPYCRICFCDVSRIGQSTGIGNRLKVVRARAKRGTGKSGISFWDGENILNCSAVMFIHIVNFILSSGDFGLYESS